MSNAWRRRSRIVAPCPFIGVKIDKTGVTNWGGAREIERGPRRGANMGLNVLGGNIVYRQYCTYRNICIMLVNETSEGT